MALAIATNNAALNAAASASSVNRDMETSMARLSTGKRINSASDDAAGVAISSRLSAEIRGTDQAIRNSLDGQALLDTAEGAHKEVENILQRMREVSVQAANDTNNSQDRSNLQAEMDAMVTEIDRIAGTTTWAGENLMSASQTDFSFQVGAATGDKNQINVTIDGMGSKNLGLAASSAAERVANTAAQTAYDALVTAETTAIASVATAFTASNDATVAHTAAVAKNTLVAAVSLQTVAGTTTTASTAGEKAAAIRDGLNAGLDDHATGMDLARGELALDIAQMPDATEKAAALVTLANVDTAIAAFKASTTDATAGSTYLDVDAKFDLAIAHAGGDTATKIAVTAIPTVDLAFADMVTTTATEVAASPAATATLKETADTKAGLLVTAEAAQATATAAKNATSDPANLKGTGLSVSSGANARTSVTTIDAAISTVSSQRSKLGAVSNRLNHTISNLSNVVSNISSARGRIEDADYAMETTNLAKNQILQRASVAMLSQANVSKGNVLGLLRG